METMTTHGAFWISMEIPTAVTKPCVSLARTRVPVRDRIALRNHPARGRASARRRWTVVVQTYATSVITDVASPRAAVGEVAAVEAGLRISITGMATHAPAIGTATMVTLAIG